MTSEKDPKPASVYRHALGLLARREHSRHELQKKLAARGLNSTEAEAAIGTLAEQNFQSDARFAEALARTRAAAGYGPIRIRAELATHRLPQETIERALAACEIDWRSAAHTLIARRFSPTDLATPAGCRKAAEFLLRRGFDRAAVYAATRLALDEDST